MTEQRTNNCTLCILIPLILGVIGLAFLYWFTKESKAEYIENDLNLKSNQLLEQKQVGGVIAEIDGRDATLKGTVVSEQRSIEIEKIIAELSGIRIIDNQLDIVIAKVEAAPETEVISEVAPEPEPEIALAPESESVSQPEVEAVKELLHTLDLSGITFLFDSNEITPKGKSILNEVVNVLSEHPEFDVIIEGHTDNVGDDDVNSELSQQRAQSVLTYLTNAGIQAENLSAVGFGESQPIADNDSVEGRALNRRIEFIVSRKP